MMNYVTFLLLMMIIICLRSVNIKLHLYTLSKNNNRKVSISPRTLMLSDPYVVVKRTNIL